jgi:hypothetical protein
MSVVAKDRTHSLCAGVSCEYEIKTLGGFISVFRSRFIF